ncbi:MAG: hypothetical protein ACOY40_01775 [Bacillota bacterium]
MKKGLDFQNFWEEYLKTQNRKILYVLGRGFDPRMCTGIEVILKLGGEGSCDCLVIEFDEGPSSPSLYHADLVLDNIEILKKCLNTHGKFLSKHVRMWTVDGPRRRRIGSRDAAEVFTNLSDFEEYTDVVIDISALPRGIYFSLIGKTLYLLDDAKVKDSSASIPNLHIVVAECAELDQKIFDVGIDDTAMYVHGFGHYLEMEATLDIPKIWIPILGEGQSVQLNKIYDLVSPDEICPVLPSPSFDPRRGDKLIIEYREILFDQWRIEPKNIIYAHEQNPFEAYRQIVRAIRHYNKSLGPLGGCKAAISALSSKLLSVGALLAAYDLGYNLKGDKISVGLAHIESEGYQIKELQKYEDLKRNVELFTLWIDGDSYEE